MSLRKAATWSARVVDMDHLQNAADGHDGKMRRLCQRIPRIATSRVISGSDSGAAVDQAGARDGAFSGTHLMHRDDGWIYVYGAAAPVLLVHLEMSHFTRKHAETSACDTELSTHCSLILAAYRQSQPTSTSRCVGKEPDHAEVHHPPALRGGFPCITQISATRRTPSTSRICTSRPG